MTPARISCLAALAVLILHGSALRDVWTIDPDASAYLGLGQSLAAGDGYSLDGIPQAKYPPGLPLLLAGVIRATGPRAYLAFQALLVVLLALGVLVSHRLVCRLGFPPWAAAMIAWAVALSQTLYDLSVRYLRTEVPFMALSLATLLLISDALARRRGWGRTALAAAFLVVTLSLRLAGVALVIVPVLHLIQPTDGSRGRARAALLLVTAGLFVAGWSAWGASVRAAHPEAPDYSAEFLSAQPRDLTKTVRVDMPTLDGSGLLRRVSGNLEVLARASAVLLTNVDRAGARLPVGIATLGLMLLGLAAMARASRPGQDAAAYVLASLTLYLLWPFNQQERFYVPLLPLLLLSAGVGLVLLRNVLAVLSSSAVGKVLALSLATALALMLSLQVSDQPTILSRWSASFAALLAVAWLAVAALAWLLHRGELPELRPQAAWLLPALFLLPWLHFRFIEWPAQVSDFEARRLARPRDPPLDRIDVDPRLEEVALWLREQTPDDTVVMTDVPKMLTVLSGRHCVPFRYSIDPAAVLPGDADIVFYTGELADVATLVAGRVEAGKFELVSPLRSLRPVEDAEATEHAPRLYRPLR